MANLNNRIAVLLAILISLTTGAAAQDIGEASAKNLKGGAVFVLTNQVANERAVYRRANDGTLTSVGTFSTGGAGDPVAQGDDPPTDPLASQGSLILGRGSKFLFAVNAGSNEISVLSVNKKGLTLVDKV